MNSKMLNLSSQTKSLLLPLSLLFLCATAQSFANTHNAGKKCLYVSSYHEGYARSDAIETSIRETLKGHCDLRKIDMDSKRNTSPEAIFGVTNRIIKTIEEWLPDVVITSDDSAAKHLIAPHYKNDKIPFVFSGVNWTVEEYGFPYKNVTGIVEVAPIKTMFRKALTISKYGRKAAFLGSDSASEKKNFNRLKLIAEEFNIQLEPLYYTSFSQWKKALEKANEYDFTIIGSSAGSTDWNNEEAIKTALEITRKPTFTTDIWMMPYSIFGFTNLATEQGEWAAEVAKKILGGTRPDEIPLASNKKWEFWVNEEILQNLQAPPSRSFLRKAKRLQVAARDE